MKKSWVKILSDYKYKTKAANVTKEEFPRLVKQVWSASFTSKQLQGGFRESGMYPFNFGATPTWKYAPALPLQAGSDPCGPRMIRGKNGQVRVETPLQTEIRQCFIEALRPAMTATMPKSQKKIQQIHYGEALTSDKVLERLKKEEEEKKNERGKRITKGKNARKKKDKDVIEDEKHCQICGALFEEWDEESHLGCDGCWRWVHYYCAGLDKMPEEEEEWLCHVCNDH